MLRREPRCAPERRLIGLVLRSLLTVDGAGAPSGGGGSLREGNDDFDAVSINKGVLEPWPSMGGPMCPASLGLVGMKVGPPATA